MRILLGILLLLSLSAQAQSPFSRDFWVNETQTPVNVNAIAEAANGYLYVGTDEGVYRFNGRTFSMMSDSIKQTVTSIAAIGNDVYVGHAGGYLGRVIGEKIVKVNAVNRGPGTRIRNISSRGKGLLWLATEEGVFLFTQGRYYRINDSHGLSDNFVYEVAKGGNNTVLAGTDNGISKIDFINGKVSIKKYGTQQGLPDNIVNVVKAVNYGAFWIGTNEGGVARLTFDKDKLTDLLTCKSTWKWGQVNDIYPISGNEAWAVTETGFLLHLDFKDSVNVRPYHFAGKKIRKLLRIKSGNIWCATNEGLAIVTVEHAAYTIAQAPYFFSTVTAMVCSGDNKLWLGQQRELLSMQLKRDTASPVREAMLPADITCMYTHGTGGGIWIGTFGKGLWHYNKVLERIEEIESLRDGHILSIATFKSRMWVASLNGVDELDINDAEGKMFVKTHHNKASGVGSDYVYQIYNDKKGRLWFATDGAGVTMYDGRKYYNWDSADGMTAKVVYSIAADTKGNIWAGTPDKGVFRYDGKKWEQFTILNGLQDMSITSVATNSTGQTLVVTQKGIDEWFPESHLFRKFNKKTNLDVESISSVLNCVAKDASGNMYVPFDKGLLIFTNLQNKVDLRPDVYINEVRLFFRPLNDNRTDFGYDENQLTFHFEGISYSNVERLHYRYKLKGYNNEWIHTDDEAITYSQLPAGKFKFIVQASLDKDFGAVKESVYSFSIDAPFWKSPWFLILAIVVVFGLLYLYIHFREKNLRKVNRLQEERMRFEYEHLKSQVNPHFLFNSLNTLSALIEEDAGKAVDYTEQLSDLYRAVLSYKNMDLIKLADEMEIIRNYMYIQQTRFGQALQLNVTIPEKILETKKVIPLALQILVENAIKHNVVSRSEPLVIYIYADEEHVTVKNDLRPKITKEEGEGLGLPNIQRRYALITKKQIVHKISDNQYIVSLPLL